MYQILVVEDVEILKVLMLFLHHKMKKSESRVRDYTYQDTSYDSFIILQIT